MRMLLADDHAATIRLDFDEVAILASSLNEHRQSLDAQTLEMQTGATKTDALVLVEGLVRAMEKIHALRAASAAAPSDPRPLPPHSFPAAL